MTHRDRDRDAESVREALAHLRAADELRTPSFDAVRWRRPQPRSQAPVVNVRRLAVAAAILLVGSGGIYGVMASRRARLMVPSEVAALSTWRATTDALLETPGRNLLRHAPLLGASLIDIKGDFR